MLLCRERCHGAKPALPPQEGPGGLVPLSPPPWPLCIIPWNGIHSTRASVQLGDLRQNTLFLL